MTSSRHREPLALLGATLIIMLWSVWSPVDRKVWILEVAPVIVALFFLVFSYRFFKLTPILYRLIFIFSIILMVGGHYTYASVPAGLWVRDALHLSRNHFDRVGHIMQGVVPAIATREMLRRTTSLTRGKMLFALCVSVALAISAFYEIFEWWTAIIAAPEQGTAFLGTQGDEWDAQKDMLMALIGAIVAQLLFSRIQDRELTKLNTKC